MSSINHTHIFSEFRSESLDWKEREEMYDEYLASLSGKNPEEKRRLASDFQKGFLPELTNKSEKEVQRVFLASIRDKVKTLLEGEEIFDEDVCSFDRVLMQIQKNSREYRLMNKNLEHVKYVNVHDSYLAEWIKYCKIIRKRIIVLNNELSSTLITCLQLADKFGISPTEVTSNQINSHLELLKQQEKENEVSEFQRKEEEAELARMELFAECNKGTKRTSEKKNTQKAKKNKKNRKPRKKSSQTETNSIRSKPIAIFSKIPTIKKQKINPETYFIQELYKIIPNLRDLNRVTKRWQTKEICHLRRISDIDPLGHIVYKYSGLSNEEILKQRARHYFPELSKFLGNHVYKTIYTLPVEGGCKMLAEWRYNGETKQGFIEFGIDEDRKIIYHRYFVPYAKVKRIFSSIVSGNESNDTEGANLQDVPEIDDDDSGWEMVSKTNFEYLPDGKIKVSFNNEEHYIVIYPLRPDILHEHLKSFNT